MQRQEGGQAPAAARLSTRNITTIASARQNALLHGHTACACACHVHNECAACALHAHLVREGVAALRAAEYQEAADRGRQGPGGPTPYNRRLWQRRVLVLCTRLTLALGSEPALPLFERVERYPKPAVLASRGRGGEPLRAQIGHYIPTSLFAAGGSRASLRGRRRRACSTCTPARPAWLGLGSGLGLGLGLGLG